MFNSSSRKTILVALIILFLGLAAIRYASVLVHRDLSGRAYIREALVSLLPPPYNVTCTGIAYTGELPKRYIDLSTALPGDLIMVNGTRGARGLVGPTGYWSNTTIAGYRGLRGFSITWQLREHKTYAAYNPDIRFYPLTPEGIRLDSAAVAGSLGNAYLLAVLPVELINDTWIRNNFRVFYSWDARVVGWIDIVNRTVVRYNDTYFATYDSASPPWERHGEPYYRLYTMYIATRGNYSFDIVNLTRLPAGYGPYVTYSYVLADYWTAQTLHIDVYFILISTLANATIANFTYPITRYTVVLDRSGTVNDFGYLNFGIPGLTIAYFNTSLNQSNIVSTRLVSIAGSGIGGVALLDNTTRNLYLVGINNTNGALAVYRYLGANRTLLASTTIPGFANYTVYNLTVTHIREPTGANRIIAHVYSTAGVLLANITVVDALISPVYPGFAVQSWDMVFSDYLFLDASLETGLVRVQNVPLGYHVELYNNGTLVARNTSTINYGPVDLIVTTPGNNFLIAYPNRMPCLNTTGIMVYRGSIYNLSTVPFIYNLTARVYNASIGYGYNTSSFILANISLSANLSFYSYISLDLTAPISPGLYLDIYLVNSTDYITSPIRIVDGVPLTTRTSPTITLSGSGNYIWIVARTTNPGYYAQLSLRIALCTSLDETICQFIKLTLILRS